MKELVAIAMLILTVGSIYGQTFTVGNLNYTVDADAPGAVILTGTTAVSEPVTIPSTVTYGDVTYAVRSIAPNAFKQSSITGDLIIPESVRVIGESAFKECSGITGIVLPATVDSIGKECFMDCTFVKELYIGDSFRYGMSYMSGRYHMRVFFRLGRSVGELTVTIGKEVERVEERLFNSTNITALIFEPESRCRTIGDNAFIGAKLAGTLNLPETIDSIGMYAFSGTRFVELNVPAGVDTISIGAFASITTLGKVNWNANPKIYGQSVFGRYSSKEEGFELVLGDSVRSIPNSLFSGAGVKSITWPTNCRIESIGSSAFSESNLTGDLTISSSVKIVGDQAFAYCSRLTSATLPHSIEQLGTGVFANCKVLERLVYDVPDVEEEFVLFGRNGSETFPTEIIIGPHVETIPTGFIYSSSIPYKVCIAGATSLKTIKRDAFYGSRGITFDSLMFPPTLEIIGNGAFLDCGSIKTDVGLPASLKSIGGSAFGGVTANSLYLGSDSIKSLGRLSLAGPLIIKKTLRHIENKLFEGSTIPAIIFEEGSMLESIGDRAFAEAKFTGELALPQGLVSIGDCAFAEAKFTGELTFPHGLVSIGEAAFKNCDQLTLAGDLPATLESIGKEAFCGCVGLNSPFPLPASLESVGDKAFYGCVGLSGTLTIPALVKSVGWDAFAGTSYTKLVVEAGAEPVQFGDNFNPTGNWIIRAPDRNRIESMSGISLPVGQFSTMEEAEINRDITYRGGLVMNMSVVSFYYSPFNGATALSRVKLGSGVTTIQPYFLTSECIAEIEVESLVPPVADKRSFSGCDYENCVLRLPEGAVNSYATAEGWKNFFTNVDPNGAVTEIKADETDATYFDLRGISVPRPNGRGIYIRRSPSGSSKLKL